MFLIKRGAIEGRIDAQFYGESLNLQGFTKLKQYVKVKGGKRIPKEMSYSEKETDYWYLRVDNINELGDIDFVNIRHISKEIFDMLESYEFKVGNIAVSNAGTIGKIALLNTAPSKRIILTENCAKLVIQTHNLLPEYLKIILNLPIIQKQMTLGYIQTTIPKLSLERIGDLLIPELPPLEIQQQIVALFETAYASKRQKEAESQALLAGIDDYLLGELGIKPLKEMSFLRNDISSTPSKKFFYTRAKEVSGNRWDSFYYKEEFKTNIATAYTGKYEVLPLHLLAQNHKLIKGKLPKDQEKGGDCKVVQINSIDDNGRIDIDNLLTAQAIFEENQAMQKEDILVVITGATIGKIGLWQYEGENYYLGGDIVKFQCNEKAIAEYVYSFLRTSIIQKEIKRHVTGATNGHLSPYDVENFPIPLPSLEKQEEIATHISALRAKAKQLSTEAAAELAAAKAQVEAMILGG